MICRLEAAGRYSALPCPSLQVPVAVDTVITGARLSRRSPGRFFVQAHMQLTPVGKRSPPSMATFSLGRAIVILLRREARIQGASTNG